MSKANNSKNWIKEHVKDPFVIQAQKDGYRSRAAYKLIEIEKKYRIIKSGSTAVDLGAAPGGWSQVLSKKIGGNGKVVAVDLLEMPPIKNIDFIQGDFEDEAVLQNVEDKLKNMPVDLVISDMAPNISGIKLVDQQRAIYLNELALEFAKNHLKQNGFFLVKSFVGADFEEYVKNLRLNFKKVFKIKPDSSRSRSSEIFLLGYEFL
ncbi:MAG: RlmE family RNA methyltransferase [Nitrosomonadales bacterium]|jgi:23S rRNA (uridine2552-2'-O)-methyltransferase|nr:RlmE family RNA methyltransferase [Nitrosomonadales bacterium]MBT3917808.1 RlmE family RNA methyltransferase [Nitrosomonadales bacterium]MBT4570970.1 RlmE family RNA methyltransferase [Nitrosomonadales bacterium]MBT4759305.1 RlmE family RNA methyltransferase [Nitrosomonadales bacterium]MBT5149712.1 RlmE family RNA methyltransferase [Nitrosomonadales bacterium]